jgi:hypothetical protein
MQYFVLRNVLVRNATVVLFTDSELEDRPERLRVFLTEGGGGGDKLSADVDVLYETVSVGGADPYAMRAFPPKMCSLTFMLCSVCVPWQPVLHPLSQLRQRQSTKLLSPAQVFSLDRGACTAVLGSVVSVRCAHRLMTRPDPDPDTRGFVPNWQVVRARGYRICHLLTVQVFRCVIGPLTACIMRAVTYSTG